MMKLILIICLCIWFFPVSIFSQTEPSDSINAKSFLIETNDGNEFIGNILKQDDKTILLSTENYGEVSIRSSFIKSIEELNQDKMVFGDYWFENPHATRYFYSPNGFGLKKNEGYYQNTWVLFNQLSMGITDNISIGGGMIPLFLFGGAPTPIWFTPKVSFPVSKNEKFNVGSGALIANILGENESTFGLLYGTSTYGTLDNNINIGVGYAFTGEGFSKHPTLTLSGMTRISKKAFLITENYLISGYNESFGIVSFGGRSVQKKLAIDYGLIIPVGDIGEFVGIPWLGITVPFTIKAQ
jgi:hypothetical protein